MIINFSNEAAILDKNSIFLAGPTVRGGCFADSWRNVACNILNECKYDGVVYVPEYSEGNVSFDLTKQANWERKCLKNAGCILFNLDRKFPENPGLTTNVEFGTYTATRLGHIIMCNPKGANKNNYLEWLYNTELEDQHKVGKIYKELEEALKESIRVAHSFL